MFKKIKQKLKSRDRESKASSSATPSSSSNQPTSAVDPRITEARLALTREIEKDGLQRRDETMDDTVARMMQEFVDHWKDREPTITTRDPHDRITDLIFFGKSDKPQTDASSPDATAADRSQAFIESAMENLLKPKPPPSYQIIKIDPTDLEQYEYSSFEEAASIRLLCFHEDEYELPNYQSQKVCSIETFRLEEAPDYLTLSYTWGAPLSDDECVASYAKDKEWIISNTIPYRVKVGRNLHEALQRITKSSSSIRYIWIDALCINQDDPHERASQVSMMGDIYSRCTRVLIWLGEMNPREAATIYILHSQMLPEIVKYMNQHGSESLQTGTWTEEEMKEKLGLGNYVRTQDWNQYARFFERIRWFSRAWVYQEVALAPEAIVLVSHLTLAWADMVLLARFLRISGLSLEVFGNSDTVTSEKSVPGAIIEVLHEMNQSATIMKSPGGLQTMATKLELTDKSRASWRVFFDCMDIMRRTQCTDPRDRIFAALGFLQLDRENSSFIAPNYEKSIETTFIEVSTILLREIPNLELLAKREDYSIRKMRELPSWVPDFTIPKGSALHNAKYDASGCAGQMPTYRLEGSKLILQGVAIETVTAVFTWNTSDGTVPEGEPVVDSMLLNWFNAVEHLTKQEVYTQDPLEVLWRTLIGNQTTGSGHPPIDSSYFRGFVANSILTIVDYLSAFPEFKDMEPGGFGHVFAPSDSKPSPALMKSLHEIWKRAKTSLYPSEEDLEVLDVLSKRALVFLTAVSKYTANRQLYVTKQGLVGLGPISMKVGDRIMYIQGSRMMFAMREQGEEYELVGETYLHGYMNGQFAESGIKEYLDDVIVC